MKQKQPTKEINMSLHKIAIVSPTDHTSIVAILEVYGKDKKDALNKVKKNPDMEGVRCWPVDGAVH